MEKPLEEAASPAKAYDGSSKIRIQKRRVLQPSDALADLTLLDIIVDIAKKSSCKTRQGRRKHKKGKKKFHKNIDVNVDQNVESWRKMLKTDTLD